MPGVREQILVALLVRLETVPAGGLIILRDGDPGDPEVILSPVTYLWEHQTEIEVILQRGLVHRSLPRWSGRMAGLGRSQDFRPRH